jgi:hypothetical protein
MFEQRGCEVVNFLGRDSEVSGRGLGKYINSQPLMKERRTGVSCDRDASMMVFE